MPKSVEDFRFRKRYIANDVGALVVRRSVIEVRPPNATFSPDNVSQTGPLIAERRYGVALDAREATATTVKRPPSTDR